jgi:lipid-binding SYLF domain-containing protein
MAACASCSVVAPRERVNNLFHRESRWLRSRLPARLLARDGSAEVMHAPDSRTNQFAMQEIVMKSLWRFGLALLILVGTLGVAHADDDSDTVKLFKDAGQSAAFFSKSYGYAVFPTIGKGGLVVGGARGSGRVYAQSKLIGDTTMTQLSIGFQAGGTAYSEIIFFQDKRALDEFTSGNFEFSAGVSAIAITSAASANAGTTGAGSSASGGKKDAATSGGFYKGMAVFTIAKGGLMYEATVAGQKFSYKPR